MSLPPTFTKPVIKRPEFDARLPREHIKRQSVIRGSGGNRCYRCSALLPLNDEQCPTCGATQIDPGLIDFSEAPAWKRRFKNIGKPKRGYNGA